MKVYEVVFDEKSDKGVYALSCVDNPAMEDIWLTLADHPKEIQFSAVDEEKRLLLGAALIPNKKIYRKVKEDEFYITFSAKTIEQAAHAFIRNGFQNNSSENHDIKLDGVSVVEAWIVEDPAKDKSAAYGKTYEKGTWVTMMKVDNDDAWEKAKNGTLNGFSIDGLFSLKEIQLNSNKMEKEQSLIDRVVDAVKGLSLSKKEEIKMGRLKLKDGKTLLEFEGDAPEIGMPIFVLSDTKERIPAPEGEHELEDGNILLVDENGLVKEEEKEDKQQDVVMAMAHLVKGIEDKFDAKLTSMVEELKKSYDSKLEEEKKKNETLEAKLEKEPAEQKIVKTELAFVEPKTAKERLFNVASNAVNHN